MGKRTMSGVGSCWRECDVEIKREGGRRGGLYTPFLFHFILPFSRANLLFFLSCRFSFG